MGYLIAWEGVVGEVLSESAFFSMVHLLEADTDLRCSVRLASSLYYKQALQVLRSYVENIVLPLYFCANPNAYRLWKRNRFRTPSFRRSDGVLSTLVNEFILSSDLADEASNLYGDLNEAVHGSESSMIHSGTVQGHWKGHVFDDRKFGQWCDYLSRAIDLGIRMTDVNLYQWSLAKPSGKRSCEICHSDNSVYKVNASSHNGVELVHYRCNECGSTFDLREDDTGSKKTLRTINDGIEVVIVQSD